MGPTVEPTSETTIRPIVGATVTNIYVYNKNLVGAVTNEPGPNRKTRSALTYPKIRQSDKSIALKLADRIANISQGGSLVEMYRKEYPEFRHGLFIPTKDQRILDMWKALDKWAEKV